MTNKEILNPNAPFLYARSGFPTITKEAQKQYADVLLDQDKGKIHFKDSVDNALLYAEDRIFLSRDLFMKQYPENVILNSGFAISNQGGVVADLVKSMRVDVKGSYTLNTSDASSDLGQISLSSEETSIRVHGYKGWVVWTNRQVQASAQIGANFLNLLFEGALRVYQKQIDNILTLGYQENAGGIQNIQGIANGLYPVVAGGPLAVDVSASGTPLFDALAQKLIIAQHNAVYNAVAYKANVMILPVTIYNAANAKLMKAASGGDAETTVLAALKRNYPEMQIFSSPLLTNQCIVYSTSRDSAVIRMPQPYTVSDQVKVSGFTTRVDFEWATAGLDVLESNSGLVLEIDLTT